MVRPFALVRRSAGQAGIGQSKMGMLFIHPIYQAWVVKWLVMMTVGLLKFLTSDFSAKPVSYHRVIVFVAMANRVSTDGETVGP